MQNEIIAPLRKITIPTINNHKPPASECCGGTPVSNTDACCKLDEEKKVEGEEGCGCGTKEKKTVTGCC